MPASVWTPLVSERKPCSPSPPPQRMCWCFLGFKPLSPSPSSCRRFQKHVHTYRILPDEDDFLAVQVRSRPLAAPSAGEKWGRLASPLGFPPRSLGRGGSCAGAIVGVCARLEPGPFRVQPPPQPGRAFRCLSP